jgi:hypothetical protein
MMWGAPAAALLLLSFLVPAAADSGSETREFSRKGSLDAGGGVELFLVEGTYRHELVSPRPDRSCEVTAGLFPANREPTVPLRDVLQADLATTSGAPGDAGSFEVSGAGWAILQVGTGPDCEWEYRITGAFHPVGEEPGPPRPSDDLGGLWSIVLLGVVIVAVAGLVARRGPQRRAEEESDVKVRVAPAPGP